MESCKTCKNRGSAWCRGCDRIVPGLERFDFYQEIEPMEAESAKESGAVQNGQQS